MSLWDHLLMKWVNMRLHISIMTWLIAVHYVIIITHKVTCTYTVYYTTKAIPYNPWYDVLLSNKIPYCRLPFLRATNFTKRAKALFSGNYFRGLRAATYMIMINSCIYVIFRWNNFRVKQKVHEIHENCGPRKKVPYDTIIGKFFWLKLSQIWTTKIVY